jgi:hypothetical protein
MSKTHRRFPYASALRSALVTMVLGALSHGAWAQSAANGGALYVAMNCQLCHGGKTISTNVGHIQLGVDAANIKNASYGLVGIAIGTQMMKYSIGQPNSLTDSDYNDLAAYLAQVVGGGVVATCTSAGVPTASAMATPVACANTGGTTTGTGGGTTGTTNASAASTTGGGGCALGRADQPTDPLWLLMLAGAAWVLRRRKPLG